MGRKLFSIMSMVVLVFGLAAGQAFAIGYAIDISPTTQPGTDFDDEITIDVGTQITIDLQLTDVPKPLLTAGAGIAYDPNLLKVVSTAIYDGTEIARDDGGAEWDAGSSQAIDLGPLPPPDDNLNSNDVPRKRRYGCSKMIQMQYLLFHQDLVYG